MNRSNGLSIVLRPVRKGSQLKSAAAGIPASLMMLSGMAAILCGWFPGAGLAWWQLALAMAAMALALWLLRLTGRGRTILSGLLILVIAGCGIAHRQVTGGLACLGNDILDRLTQVTGRIWLDLAASGGSSALWGIIPLAGVFVILMELTVETGRIGFVMPVLLGVYGAVLFGLFPVGGGVILLGLGTVLLIMQGPSAREGSQSWWGVPTWLPVLGLCLLAAVGIGLNFGENESGLEKLQNYYHSVLFDRETNSMPEGELKNLSAWKKNDTPALKITMTEPQKLYLRGAVYETYDGGAWTALPPEEKAEEESLFYWLHRTGFFGQSQIGTAAALTGQAELKELTVENLTACRAHGYYPYALGDSGSLDEALIGDTDLPEAKTMSYVPGSVPQWYEVQQLLASAQETGDIARYLAGEEAYEAYVTEKDLQLTNESWSVLNRQLAGEEPRTLSQIRAFIRSWLEENMVYDEQVRTLNGGSDFLQYTLERSGSGYSVHYATAATLMLRYFGVPARYVEGYFLSAEEAASYQAGQTIILTENHAHAWAEYYLPGVGFVPFEVTPGYMDDEELELGGSLQEQQIYSGEHLKYAQVEQPEKIEEPRQDRISFSLKPEHLLYLLLALVLALAVMVWIRRRRFQKAISAIELAPNREAIAMRFGYAHSLRATCATVMPEGARLAEELNREALFSDHEMTDDQRSEMDAYARQVLDACKNTWTVPQKLRYWLWDCLY